MSRLLVPICWSYELSILEDIILWNLLKFTVAIVDIIAVMTGVTTVIFLMENQKIGTVDIAILSNLTNRIRTMIVNIGNTNVNFLNGLMT